MIEINEMIHYVSFGKNNFVNFFKQDMLKKITL